MLELGPGQKLELVGMELVGMELVGMELELAAHRLELAAHRLELAVHRLELVDMELGPGHKLELVDMELELEHTTVDDSRNIEAASIASVEYTLVAMVQLASMF